MPSWRLIEEKIEAIRGPPPRVAHHSGKARRKLGRCVFFSSSCWHPIPIILASRWVMFVPPTDRVYRADFGPDRWVWMLQAASLNEAQISRSGDFLAFLPAARQANLRLCQLLICKILPSYLFNDAEGNHMKKAKGKMQGVTFSRVTKNQDGLLLLF